MPRSTFAQRLIAWHRRHGRHDLPWQREPTPYRVWVSEIMLQQTQVATVIPYFRRFVERFPTLPELAAGDIDQVLALWSGLGYYARARNLHRAARFCVEHHGGELPSDFEALTELPGIGRSTAGAVLALAHDRPYPILDGNAKRVLARYHAIGGWPGHAAVGRRLWKLAESHLPQRRAARYTQALMDLGATVCRRSRPACAACPLRARCLARRRGDPEAYPGRRARPRRPHRETAMVLITDERGRVLLLRRPPAGIWGGLWSLPEVAPDARLDAAVAETTGVRITRPRRLETLRHGFTHYTLDIHPWRARAAGETARIMDADDRRWLHPADALALGLPRPVRALMQRHADTPCPEPSSA